MAQLPPSTGHVGTHPKKPVAGVNDVAPSGVRGGDSRAHPDPMQLPRVSSTEHPMAAQPCSSIGVHS